MKVKELLSEREEQKRVPLFVDFENIKKSIASPKAEIPQDILKKGPQAILEWIEGNTTYTENFK